MTIKLRFFGVLIRYSSLQYQSHTNEPIKYD